VLRSIVKSRAEHTAWPSSGLVYSSRSTIVSPVGPTPLDTNSERLWVFRRHGRIQSPLQCECQLKVVTRTGTRQLHIPQVFPHFVYVSHSCCFGICKAFPMRKLPFGPGGYGAGREGFLSRRNREISAMGPAVYMSTDIFLFVERAEQSKMWLVKSADRTYIAPGDARLDQPVVHRCHRERTGPSLRNRRTGRYIKPSPAMANHIKLLTRDSDALDLVRIGYMRQRRIA
jgi:hypothetical protein